MMIAWGSHEGSGDWGVKEPGACGYVRAYCIRGGKVVCREGDYTGTLGAGQICFFPSTGGYTLEQDPEDWLRCTYFHLSIAPFLLHRTVVLEAAFHPILGSIFDAVDGTAQEKRREVAGYLAEAVEAWCRETAVFSPAGGAIARPLAAMSQHYEKDWTIGELSRMAGYAPGYFVRRFRLETGLSPHRYLVARRMRAAAQLLREGLPVTRVAEKTGYPELKAFSRAFRQWYGMSPTQLRRNEMRLP